MLNRHRGAVVTRDNAADIVEQGLSDMQKVYGRGFLSAITKALWMMKQHPVVIYDSKAKRGLRQLRPAPEYKDYRSYFNAWFRFFDDPHTQKGLDDGLSWLPESPAARALIKGGKTDSEEIQRLAASTLFRNRVTDIRLFYAGGGVL